MDMTEEQYKTQIETLYKIQRQIIEENKSTHHTIFLKNEEIKTLRLALDLMAKDMRLLESSHTDLQQLLTRIL